MLAAAILLAAALVIAYQFRSYTFDWRRVIATFAGMSPGWLILSLPFGLATYLGRALRWRVMVRPIRPEASLANILNATVIGFTAMVLFGRAGELVRPYLIAVKEKVSFSSQMAAWLLERIYDLLVILVLLGASLLTISPGHGPTGPAIGFLLRVGGYLIGSIGLVAVAVLFALGRLSPDSEKSLLDSLANLVPAWHDRIERLAAGFLEGTRSSRNQSFVLQILLYSLLEWALIAASVGCVFLGFPPSSHFGIADTLLFVGFVSFGNVVQIPGVGGGMQVATVVILTQFFHLGLEASASLALVVWVFSMVTVVPWGLIQAFREGLEWRKLRQLEPR